VIDVVVSEWLKVRSLRSTSILLAVLFAGVAGAALLAWQAAQYWDHLSPVDREHYGLSPLEPIYLQLAEVCLAVLGVLAVTTEYTSGMIRTSLVAVPQRRLMLAAKAGVLGAVALAAGLAGVFATSAISRAIIGDRPIRFFAVPESHTTQLLFAQSAELAVVALVGLGLGAILRSTVGAVVCMVALLYLIPMTAQSLPSPWDDRVNSVMMHALPGQLVGAGNPNSIFGSALSPPAALAVMLGYVLVPLGLAALLIRRRDA
jgi:ABC-type transport system involved in multi-copper enzyme maturation permease subunit